MDVGGYWYNWSLYRIQGTITCLNIDPQGAPPAEDPGFRSLVCDAREMPVDDGAFDLAFSNSVIEHVGTLDDQRRFASEVCRVAGKVFIQTPNRTFFVEPHLITPLFHFLPRSWQYRLVRWCTVWGWVTRPTAEEGRAFLDDIRLLSYEEMVDLFPGCSIHREKFLGLFTKSLIAIRGHDSSQV